MNYALVAGAVCIVTFTAYSSTTLYEHLYHDASLVTLNINSTGAKTVGVKSTRVGTEGFATIDCTILVLYNESRYSVLIGHMYPDYNDTD